MTQYRIDCSAVSDARRFHEALAQALSFPDWYGHNLDALFDCLTELEAPVQLILEHWDSSVPYATDFESVFMDAQQENPDFTVVFE